VPSAQKEYEAVVERNFECTQGRKKSVTSVCNVFSKCVTLCSQQGIASFRFWSSTAFAAMSGDANVEVLARQQRDIADVKALAGMKNWQRDMPLSAARAGQAQFSGKRFEG
jgi:hypothetical protein